MKRIVSCLYLLLSCFYIWADEGEDLSEIPLPNCATEWTDAEAFVEDDLECADTFNSLSGSLENIGEEEIVFVMPPSRCATWWADVELLYWKAFLGDGLEYADTFNPLSGSLGNANAVNLNLKAQPGVRAKLGYVNHMCQWDTTLNYTYYHNHTQASKNGTLFPSLLFFGGPLAGITTVTSAQADWHLNFQYVDLDFGRPIWWGCSFALHPHIGIRGAWIDQQGKVAYRGGQILNGAFTIDLKNNFWGCGIKTGLDGNYQLSPCWSVFSDLSASLLWGHFNVKQIQVQAGVAQINLSEEFSQLIPTAQAALGIAWQRKISWWCPLLVLSAAVEGQYWWRQNHVERFTDSVFAIHTKKEQDLSLFGLTLKATVYF